METLYHCCCCVEVHKNGGNEVCYTYCRCRQFSPPFQVNFLLISIKTFFKHLLVLLSVKTVLSDPRQSKLQITPQVRKQSLSIPGRGLEDFLFKRDNLMAPLHNIQKIDSPPQILIYIFMAPLT